MLVSQSKLARSTPNLVCSFWLCGSIVANPIIYRLVPSPSRYEIRQWLCGIYKRSTENCSFFKISASCLFLTFQPRCSHKSVSTGSRRHETERWSRVGMTVVIDERCEREEWVNSGGWITPLWNRSLCHSIKFKLHLRTNVFVPGRKNFVYRTLIS